MAHQAVIAAVVGERNGAVRTGDAVAALGAGHKGMMPPAVEQQDALSAVLQIVFQFFEQD